MRIEIAIVRDEDRDEATVSIEGLGARLLLEQVLPALRANDPGLNGLTDSAAIARIVSAQLRAITRQAARLWEV